MTTYATAAALRSCSESPFVAPAGAASWQVPVSITGDAQSGFAGASGIGSHDATFLVIKPLPTFGADTRVTAMQDRPPRGVPR